MADKALFVIVVAAILVVSFVLTLIIAFMGSWEDEPVHELVLTEDTTWTTQSSPYLFDQDVIVEEGVTLTVEPDVVVKFEKYRRPGSFWVETGLKVKGTLVAGGSKVDQTIFTYASGILNGRWAGITLEATSTNSQLIYCRIEYADVGLALQTTRVELVENTFKGNSRGLSLNVNGLTVQNNIFISNTCGISTYYGGTIANNLFRDNHNGIECQNYGEDGPDIHNNMILRNQAYGIRARSTDCGKIHNNSILQNGGYGIYLSQESNVDVYQNKINQNGAYGIYIEGSSPNIHNNSIMDNDEYGIAIEEYVQRGPEDVRDPEDTYYVSDVTITNNNISGNLIGIYIFDSWADIHNNNIISNRDFALVNHCDKNIDASNNWWGTTVETEIEAMIQGVIDYEPWLLEPV